MCSSLHSLGDLSVTWAFNNSIGSSRGLISLLYFNSSSSLMTFNNWYISFHTSKASPYSLDSLSMNLPLNHLVRPPWLQSFLTEFTQRSFKILSCSEYVAISLYDILSCAVQLFPLWLCGMLMQLCHAPPIWVTIPTLASSVWTLTKITSAWTFAWTSANCVLDCSIHLSAESLSSAASCSSHLGSSNLTTLSHLEWQNSEHTRNCFSITNLSNNL